MDNRCLDYGLIVDDCCNAGSLGLMVHGQVETAHRENWEMATKVDGIG